MGFVRIGGYPMDLALNEGHTFPGEVTEFPVEQGPDITDHIRDLPEEITLECIVSDTPVGDIASDPTRRIADGTILETSRGTFDTPLPSEDALAKLLELKALRKPLTIETSLGHFESMAFTELEVPRDKGKSLGLFFTAKFKRIVIVTNRRTRVRVKTNLANGGKGKAASGITAPIDDTIVWRHGVPPGAPWKEPNPVETIGVRYTRQHGLSRDEIRAIDRAAPSTPFILYIYGEGPLINTEIAGIPRINLVADLNRDATAKGIAQMKELTAANAAAAVKAKAAAAKRGGKNLPPGVDTSRIKRPPKFPGVL